jgi:hypothetical protein
MKGVYYRTGVFKGHSVDRIERIHIDTGLLAITNKNIYFSGEENGFRIPYAKIVAFHPFDEGVGIIRDTANAKLQIFVTGDGWFTYNLMILGVKFSALLFVFQATSRCRCRVRPTAAAARCTVSSCTLSFPGSRSLSSCAYVLSWCKSPLQKYSLVYGLLIRANLTSG